MASEINKAFSREYSLITGQQAEVIRCTPLFSYFKTVYTLIIFSRRADVTARINRDDNQNLRMTVLFLIESLMSATNLAIYSSLFSVRAAEESLLSFLIDIYGLEYDGWRFKEKKEILIKDAAPNQKIKELISNQMTKSYADISAIFHDENNHDMETIPEFITELTDLTEHQKNIEILNAAASTIFEVLITLASDSLINWKISEMEDYFRMTFSRTKSDKLIDYFKK